MTTKITSYARAAQHLPMAWLAQADFPARTIVKESFKDALRELPAPDGYDDSVLRSALEIIVSGPDPRGGTFKAQAVQAAGPAARPPGGAGAGVRGTERVMATALSHGRLDSRGALAALGLGEN
jgi:hypothetical protein